MALADSWGRAIKDSNVNESLQTAVIQLDELMNLASQLQSQDVKAASEVLISGGTILKHANAKIFAYFLTTLQSLGKEIANLGALQQVSLLHTENCIRSCESMTRAKQWPFDRHTFPWLALITIRRILMQ